MSTETALVGLAVVALVVFYMRPRSTVTIGTPLVEFGEPEILDAGSPAPLKILGPKAPTVAP